MLTWIGTNTSCIVRVFYLSRYLQQISFIWGNNKLKPSYLVVKSIVAQTLTHAPYTFRSTHRSRHPYAYGLCTIYNGLRSLCITGVGLRSLVNMSRSIPGWSQLPNRVHYLGLEIKTAQERRIGSVRKKKLTSRRFFFHRGTLPPLLSLWLLTIHLRHILFGYLDFPIGYRPLPGGLRLVTESLGCPATPNGTLGGWPNSVVLHTK